MRAAPRLRNLDRRRDTAAAGRFAVGERVEHRGGTIEVRHQEVTGVVGKQRIQPDEYVTDKVGGDHVGREPKV
jgi:hypothetical protein